MLRTMKYKTVGYGGTLNIMMGITSLSLLVAMMILKAM